MAHHVSGKVPQFASTHPKAIQFFVLGSGEFNQSGKGWSEGG